MSDPIVLAMVLLAALAVLSQDGCITLVAVFFIVALATGRCAV